MTTNTQNKLIFDGFGYTACFLGKHQILTVTRKNKTGDHHLKGKYLQGDEAIKWATAIENALADDLAGNAEAAMLCKAIYN